MDTNQDGVSLQDVADLLEQDEEQMTDESGEQEGVEEIAASDDPEAPEEPQEEGDDAEEVEFEGKTYKLPKELKGALLRQADYTTKTQAVAEQRKALEEKAQLFEAQQRLAAVTFDKRVELREIENKLAQFQQVDWDKLSIEDPAQATRLNIAFQQLQQQANRKTQELQQAHAHAEQLTATQRQQMLAEAQQELKQRLPNFGAETAEKIKSSAKSYGLTDAELNSVIDPRYVHILHDAMQWRALQEAKPKAMQKVAEAPKVVKPQAAQPKPRINQAAVQRLQKNGRIEDLAALL